MSAFDKKLAFGQIGESKIAKWFNRRGYTVLPVYEKEIDTGKGPRIFAPKEQIIAPDILVFKANKILWIEAKHKSGFSWHRKTGRWVTGIDLKHYLDYLKVKDYSPAPVWLLFLQDGLAAKDSPVSPSGLFGQSLDVLRKCENHRHAAWGISGMVYWAIDSPLDRQA